MVQLPQDGMWISFSAACITFSKIRQHNKRTSGVSPALACSHLSFVAIDGLRMCWFRRELCASCLLSRRMSTDNVKDEVVKNPNMASFEVVADFCQDGLRDVKLMCFICRKRAVTLSTTLPD